MVAKQTPTSSFKSFLHAKDYRSRVQPKLHVATIHRQQAMLQSISTVYAGSMGQAAVLQRLFDAADGLILAEDALVRIARRICSTWEPQQQTPSYVASFVKFIKFILSHTNEPGEPYTLDFAQRICHYRRSAFPTVHAPLVLLLALGYLERLSRRYHDTRGEPGCAQRLFLISYTIAAKYLHANLAFIPISRLPTFATHRGRSARSRSPPSRSQSPTNNTIRSSSYSSTIKSEPALPSLSIHHNYVAAAAVAAAAVGAGIALNQSNSLTTMTTSTNFLARVIQNVSARELYRMELEFLCFLDYDLAVYSVAEVEGWRELYVGPKNEEKWENEITIKKEADEAIVKMEDDEDEGIGHLEAEDGHLMM